tara:strand:+ start:234 stop:794 length:561 start_codon:yes stop_codon:yes gene_type:complete
MAIVLNGNGTLTGLTTGGVSDTKAIADAAMPQGAIINESSVNETGTVSSSAAQGGYSGALISISYAAASSSNKLLVIAQFNIATTTGAATYGTLHVAGSPSYRGTADGSRLRVTTSARSGNSGGLENCCIVHLISTPSTSSTAYDVRGSHAQDATQTMYLNRTDNDVNQNYEGRCASSITILEFVG